MNYLLTNRVVQVIAYCRTGSKAEQQYFIVVYTCLTSISFASQRKCEQYWPDNVNDTYDAGNLSVTLTDLVPYADYEINRFSIKDVSVQ